VNNRDSHRLDKVIKEITVCNHAQYLRYSPMTPTLKLTKKQRKGLAFRQKNLGQSKDLPEEDSSQLVDEATEHNPPSGTIGKRKRDNDELVRNTDSKKVKITAAPSQSSTGNRSSRYILFVGDSKSLTIYGSRLIVQRGRKPPVHHDQRVY
jgi:hypothetical protein